MNFLRRISGRLGLNLPLNRLLYGYIVFLLLLVLLMTVMSVPPMTRIWAVGIG